MGEFQARTCGEQVEGNKPAALRCHANRRAAWRDQTYVQRAEALQVKRVGELDPCIGLPANTVIVQAAQVKTKGNRWSIADHNPLLRLLALPTTAVRGGSIMKA